MRGRKKIVRILLIVLVIIFIVSIVGIVFYLGRQEEAKDVNERLQEIAAKEQSTKEKNSDSESTSAMEEAFVSPIDFEALQEENADIYGWIRIEDTAIDYPILQSSTDDPDYYTNYTVDGTEGYPGAIFTESDLNTDPFEDAVTVVYGHRMKNDTMFGSLDLWTDDSYRQEHSTIKVYTQKHTYTYEITFVQAYDTRNILANYDCNTEEGYSEFLQSLENVRMLPYWHSDEKETSTEDTLIVLSTCYGDNRLLVGAVLTEKES